MCLPLRYADSCARTVYPTWCTSSLASLAIARSSTSAHLRNTIHITSCHQPGVSSGYWQSQIDLPKDVGQFSYCFLRPSYRLPKPASIRQSSSSDKTVAAGSYGGRNVRSGMILRSCSTYSSGLKVSSSDYEACKATQQDASISLVIVRSFQSVIVGG